MQTLKRKQEKAEIEEEQDSEMQAEDEQIIEEDGPSSV
jgi:hypothetical protein